LSASPKRKEATNTHCVLPMHRVIRSDAHREDRRILVE
jgi:hypothetical protein